jgi:hypothetical protein
MPVSAAYSSVDNRFSVRNAKTTSAKMTSPVPSEPPNGHGRQAGTGSSSASSDASPVEGVLKLLARAIRQFHTYPATSPICIDAVVACQEALSTLPQRDRVASRVTPHDLIIDEVHIGAGTVVEQELTRRLFRLRVAALDIDRTATPRDLSRFCIDLVEAESDDLERSGVTFAERLAEHGVSTIVPGMAHRPAVLDVGNPPAAARDLVDYERRRHAELVRADAPVSYLYPPDKGWVRLDPGQTLDTISLVDLVVLVEDPADIATMLLRLTDDDVGAGDVRQTALERKFSDVSMLFSALDPRMAQVMFGRLARAVLELEPQRRTNLMQRTILPGLLDGRADGKVLRDFPDIDLAESICLLLDLETAAPEVLSTALNRLDLTPDRRNALAPLIDERLRAQRHGQTADTAATGTSGIARYARELIKVDAKRSTDFSDFAAFDLSIDIDTVAAVTNVRDGIAATDMLTTQLRCVSQLVRIEPNPTLVEAFLRRALDLLGTLEQSGRWGDLTSAIKGYTELGAELATRRPDVTETIRKSLSGFCTPSRMLALVNLHERDADGKAIVDELARALGPALVPGFVALIDRPAHQPKARAFTPLLCEMAPSVAEALLAEIETCGVVAARVIVKLLGHAGAGHELAVARLTQHQDAAVAREAFRSLARMGTPTAAALVTRQIREGGADRSAAAEDALWHFPSAQTVAQLRELFRSREFVLKHAPLISRLIDRAAQTRLQGLGDVLTALEPLRFRFWNPTLVHVALKARELRAR